MLPALYPVDRIAATSRHCFLGVQIGDYGTQDEYVHVLSSRLRIPAQFLPFAFGTDAVEAHALAAQREVKPLHSGLRHVRGQHVRLDGCHWGNADNAVCASRDYLFFRVEEDAGDGTIVQVARPLGGHDASVGRAESGQAHGAVMVPGSQQSIVAVSPKGQAGNGGISDGYCSAAFVSEK
jgi:hypothetical protein